MTELVTPGSPYNFQTANSHEVSYLIALFSSFQQTVVDIGWYSGHNATWALQQRHGPCPQGTFSRDKNLQEIFVSTEFCITLNILIIIK